MSIMEFYTGQFISWQISAASWPAVIIFARLPGLQQSARLEEVQAAAGQLAAEICQEINWPV